MLDNPSCNVKLPIMPQAGMCGMKRDCGGAAGMLGAFYLAVKMVRVHVVTPHCSACIFLVAYVN